MKTVQSFIKSVVLLLLLASVLTILCEIKGCPSDCYVDNEKDCLDYKLSGHNESGVYTVKPIGMRIGYKVYCDMTTDDGGWLVFQRRMDGTVDFDRYWLDYSLGFGNVTHEHWLGLIPLKRILSQGYYELRIDLQDWNDDRRYAKYTGFNLDDQTVNYKLYVFSYSGDAGDALHSHYGEPFYAYSRPTGKDDDCPETFDSSKRWYNHCGASNLNGKYYPNVGERNGIFWNTWQNHSGIIQEFYSLKMVEMKIRGL